MASNRNTDDQSSTQTDVLFNEAFGELVNNLNNSYLLIPKIKIFQHLDDEKQKHLAGNLNVVQFNHGENIVQEGEEGHDFFIILEGTAGVFQKLSQDQSAVEVSKLGQHDYIGAIALQLKQLHAATVQAIGPVTCVKMSRDDFERDVRPIIDDLREKADQYHSFIRLHV